MPLRLQGRDTADLIPKVRTCTASSAEPTGSPTPIGRRDALRVMASCAAGVLGVDLPVAFAWRAFRPAASPQHPEPRAGITAARVLTAAQLRAMDAADAITAFDEVRRIPQIVDGIRCHCGCADEPGHYSLLSCFEGEGMARNCVICRGQGRMAYRLARAGRTLAEIRRAIDDRYA